MCTASWRPPSGNKRSNNTNDLVRGVKEKYSQKSTWCVRVQLSTTIKESDVERLINEVYKRADKQRRAIRLTKGPGCGYRQQKCWKDARGKWVFFFCLECVSRICELISRQVCTNNLLVLNISVFVWSLFLQYRKCVCHSGSTTTLFIWSRFSSGVSNFEDVPVSAIILEICVLNSLMDCCLVQNGFPHQHLAFLGLIGIHYQPWPR